MSATDRRPQGWLLRLPCLLVCFAPACVHADLPPRYAPAWEAVDPETPGWLRTGKQLLIADCQLHNLLSMPLPERNLSIEAASATAIRPPQLDLFATDVLAYIVQRHAPDVDLIVHLGDALDLACEGELDAFLQVMHAAGKPWVMAPGNHDFYYFGSYDPDDPELWAAACHRAGGRLTKGAFIRRYVGALTHQAAFGELAAALRDQGTMPDDFEWQAAPGSPSQLRRICWHIDDAQPWRSFVLQLVEAMPADNDPQAMRIQTLLLDSCQYGRRPALIPNAWNSYPVALNCGFTGEMLPNQLRKAREWIVGGDAVASVIAMYHHPFTSLQPRTRASLGWLWREHRLGMTVTAHTHKGYFATHDLGGESDELELNIGSTTDWPMEWRTLQAFANPQEQRIYIASERHTLVDALRTDGGGFQRDWEVPYGAADDYRRYRQGSAATGLLFDFYLAHHLVPNWLGPPSVHANDEARDTELQVKQTLLWTYLRLIQVFPTDPTSTPTWPGGCADDHAVLCRIHAQAGARDDFDGLTGFLGELAAFERTRRTRDPRSGAPTDAERGRFKLSQAAWAARFEGSKGRNLQVEDQLIRVDWERTQRKHEQTVTPGQR